MKRTRTLITAVALLASVAAVNCAKDNSDVGAVRLALTVPGGYTVNTVSYTVQQGSTVLLGPATFDVTDPNSKPSLDIALPPATGLTITLKADATNGHHFEGTSGLFNIISGQTTLVDVTLTDALGTPAQAPGIAVVNGVIVPNNLPPAIASVVVAPSQTSVGANITVTVVASDPDAGDTLTYLWTSNSASGAFASATSASTTYTSSAAGSQLLSIKVTDSHGSFVTVASLPVTFIGAPTGAAGTSGAAGTEAAAGTGAAGTSAAAGTSGAAGTEGAAGTSAAGTSGAAGTSAAGGTTGAAGTAAGPSALELAEVGLGDIPTLNLLTAQHAEDDNGEQTPVGWGPDTLPSPEQRTAAKALIRRIASLLPASARNASNTGPYAPGDVNVLNALLNLNASPIDLFTGSNLAPRAGTALDAYIAAVVSDTNAPAGPFYLHGLAAGLSDGAYGAYISGNGTDPQGVVGLVTNIVKVALLNGFEAQLQAY